MAETLAGTIEKIVYQNAASQWMVARVAPEDGGPTATVVGALFGVTEGTPLLLHGAWVNDRRFGRQFKVETYATKAPETLVGIEKYLGSGLIPGIGPELARRIVQKYGMETLELINEDPTKLTNVDGIGEGRAARIAEAWIEQRDVQDVMIFLRGHGVPSAYAARIYKRYGAEAIGIIRANPYRLSIDIRGIGFKTADGIAQSLGIGPDAPERLEAGLVHLLGELASDGHCHAPELELLERTAQLLEVEPDQLRGPLEQLVASNLLVSEELGDRGTCLSLTGMWDHEHTAAEAFAALATTPAHTLELEIEAAIAQFQEQAAISLAPQQQRAIAAATRDKCVVITGGPGVGKTTIVRGILAILQEANRRCALAAPTGRAAKRLAETTGYTAQTLHRLLAFQPRTNSFERNAESPIDAHVIIVDESSMIDIALFRALVTALPPEAQLVLVGDIDQLPSVGAGSVLRDVIESEVATVVKLTEIFRQAAESAIVVNAHRINRGELPELEPNKDADFFFIERADPIAGRELIVELVANRIPARFGFDPVSEVQVLTPMHRGDLGTQALNTALQERLCPGGTDAVELVRGERRFRVGDKVMQIRNDYDKEVFNGDLGVIAAFADGNKRLIVELLDGRRAEYERDEIDQLVHAYAVSVHKSQGSEYPAVVIPVVTQHYMMLQRNLLYTAITRGKQLVVLVGTRKAVSLATQNDATRLRWTWLAHRIHGAAQTEPPELFD